MPRRYTSLWSAEEDQTVIDLRRKGHTIAYIVLKLPKRSWYGVHCRVRRFEDTGELPKMSQPWSERIERRQVV